MTSLREEARAMNDLIKLWEKAELRNPSLVVGWHMDAGRLGERVTDYLNRKLGGQSAGEIEPSSFFPLSGVTVEGDLIRFPESRFYACPRNDLLLFKGTTPSHEWFKYLNLILDAATYYGQVKEIYTIGGMVSAGAHTTPRELVAGFNSPKLKETLERHNVATNIYYETPPGHRPTLSSFLLWTARQRNIMGAALWVPIPFYLVTVQDAQAQRKMLEFFDQELGLQIDFQDIDEEIRQQNEKITQARMESPEIDEYISKLEGNLSLDEADNEKLIKEMEAILGRKRNRI